VLCAYLVGTVEGAKNVNHYCPSKCATTFDGEAHNQYNSARINK
jgi:hypothetical protein